MRQSCLIIFAALTLSAFSVQAQISPGDLSKAHAEFEGMSNCTMCHDLGKKVSNAKCLDCHKEIQTLIKKNRGYHSQRDVKAKDCFDCHSEHHGRKFDMIRLETEQFDHALTRYELEGKHAVVDCRDCHAPEYISNPEIRKRENTFLGLEQNCISCHDDYHQKTLADDCMECHDMEAFRPAPKFDHDDADFKLAGKHIEVDCKECHNVSIRNGKEFQQFADVPFNDCVECHSDPHNDHFQVKCKQCHTESAFEQFVGKRKFNHHSTAFKLKGKHKTVDCYTCHKESTDPLLVFQDNLNVNENKCASCHDDQHEGKFGNDCAKCHSEKGFLNLKSMDFFDHSVTDFPLEGLHFEVDCKACHTKNYSDPIDFSACNSCHEDYHEGEFIDNGSPDCNQCHSLDKGFGHSLYLIEQHQASKFPLEGAHLATPCMSCHMKEEKWTFRSIGMQCYECHDNPHDERFAVEGVTDCNRCHDSSTWFPSKFDHNLTKFPLEGRHLEIACNDCHQTIEEEGKTFVNYKLEKFECVDCHQ